MPRASRRKNTKRNMHVVKVNIPGHKPKSMIKEGVCMEAVINNTTYKAMARIQKIAQKTYKKHGITEEEAEKRLREALLKDEYTRY